MGDQPRCRRRRRLPVTGDTLQPIGEVPSGGSWPRGLTLAAGDLLVANQHSDTFTALPVLDTGALGRPGRTVRSLRHVRTPHHLVTPHPTPATAGMQT